MLIGRSIKKTLSMFIAIVFLLTIISIIVLPQSAQAAFTGFITRSGDKLMDGSNEFRFISANMPAMFNTRSSLSNSVFTPPTDWEIEDAIKTASQMDLTVVRPYTLGIKKSSDPSNIQKQYMAPGVYNEDAWRKVDKALQLANQYNVMLIIPFIDNYNYSVGGINDFAALREKSGSVFYTDSQLIQDFKDLVSYTLNRTNYYTGIQYKNDPSILAWETGNELNAPDSWTADIAAYIKSIDTNHLVMDGKYGISVASLNNPNIDIVSNHYYYGDYAANCDSDRNLSKGKKPFIVGEFGIVGTTAIHSLLDKVISNGTAGAMIWSIRQHNEKGGFFCHQEGTGSYYSYRWPGFPEGNGYDETNVLSLIRNHEYEIRGLSVPELPAPEAPVLLPITSLNSINWKGSVGAQNYDVERATAPDGPWTVVGTNISDGKVPNPDYSISLFSDTTAPTDIPLYYRVTAKNTSGTSSPSNVVSVPSGGATPSEGATPSGGATPSQSDTIVDDANASIVYNGSWNFEADASYYNNTKHTSNSTGAYAELTFTGSTVSVYTKNLSAGGKFDVYIDSVYDSTVDTYHPTDIYMAKVYEKTGLSYGSHTIRILLNGQKNASSSDYWVGLDYLEYDLFNDDFSDDDFTADPTWTVESGSFSVISDGGNNVNSCTGTSFITAGNTLWDNYTYQARMKLNATGVDGSLWFRYTNSSNSYLCKLYNDGSGDTVELWKVVNGTTTKIASASATINNSTWYNVKVVVNGTSIKCYLDDVLKIDTTDTSFSLGKIGVKMYDGLAYYDDVFVTQ